MQTQQEIAKYGAPPNASILPGKPILPERYVSAVKRHIMEQFKTAERVQI